MPSGFDIDREDRHLQYFTDYDNLFHEPGVSISSQSLQGYYHSWKRVISLSYYKAV